MAACNGKVRKSIQEWPVMPKFSKFKQWTTWVDWYSPASEVGNISSWHEERPPLYHCDILWLVKCQAFFSEKKRAHKLQLSIFSPSPRLETLQQQVLRSKVQAINQSLRFVHQKSRFQLRISCYLCTPTVYRSTLHHPFLWYWFFGWTPYSFAWFFVRHMHDHSEATYMNANSEGTS